MRDDERLTRRRTATTLYAIIGFAAGILTIVLAIILFRRI